MRLTAATVSSYARLKSPIKYKDSANDVKYEGDLTVSNTKDGVTYLVDYHDVFLLKPGETAEIMFPTFGTTGVEKFVEKYYIVECGVNPDVFQSVSIGNQVIAGETAYAEKKQEGETVVSIPRTDSGLKDYAIQYDTLENRPRVTYANEVKETKALTISKELYKKEGENRQRVDLYDDHGELLVPEDHPDLDRTFDFRVYFKTPYESEYTGSYNVAYHVKDPAGYYCRWNKGISKFERITNETYEDGIRDYNNLSEEEKSQATFDVSLYYGAISEIPAYYTVEIRELIPGTDFKVVERPAETPDGYKFWKYELDDGTVKEGDASEGITGSITSNGAAVKVCNDKGYGLRLVKTWADASTIKDRDPAYFAVFYEETNPESGEIERSLVNGSVQRLDYGAASSQKLYWWYQELPVSNTIFERYVVYEVNLEGDGITVDENGTVTGYSSVTPILQGGLVSLNGTSAEQGSTPVEIHYRVTYAEPEEIGDNVRKFAAVNTPSDRPAVRFVKEDWTGQGLPNGHFTLSLGETQLWSGGREWTESMS